jgi:hypothetical protein
MAFAQIPRMLLWILLFTNSELWELLGEVAQHRMFQFTMRKYAERLRKVFCSPDILVSRVSSPIPLTIKATSFSLRSMQKVSNADKW